MDAKQQERLRAEFPAERVGLLPKSTCRACSHADDRVCGNHKKVSCEACGNWITEAHMHLEYVGHGAVTERLLEVDPEWSWEPVVLTPAGAPGFNEDNNGNPIGFWIRLTVAGVTRLGFGDCPKTQDNPEKVLIGDALRNAAMRFGVGLDLWIKGHLEDVDQSPTSRPERQRQQQQSSSRGRSRGRSYDPAAEAAAEAEAENRAKDEGDPLVSQELRNELIAAVRDLDDVATQRFVELWVADRNLPTKGDPPVPAFNPLKESQLPAVRGIFEAVESENPQAGDKPGDTPEPETPVASGGELPTDAPSEGEPSMAEFVSDTTEYVRRLKVAQLRDTLVKDWEVDPVKDNKENRARLVALMVEDEQNRRRGES